MLSWLEMPLLTPTFFSGRFSPVKYVRLTLFLVCDQGSLYRRSARARLQVCGAVTICAILVVPRLGLHARLQFFVCRGSGGERGGEGKEGGEGEKKGQGRKGM